MNVETDKVGLTFAQHEALAILSEESGEVCKAAGKVFRHGLTATDYSVYPPVAYNNREDLVRELADVLLGLTLAARVGLLPDEQELETLLDNYMRMKVPSLRARLHAPELVAALDEVAEMMGVDNEEQS